MITLNWNSVRPFQCFKLSQAAITLPHSTRRVSVGPLKVLEKYESAQQVFSKLNGWDATIEKRLELWKVLYAPCMEKRDFNLLMNCIYNCSCRNTS